MENEKNNAFSELKELSFGQIIGKSFSLCFNNIGPVLLISLIVGIIALIPTGILGALNAETWASYAENYTGSYSYMNSLDSILQYYVFLAPYYLLFAIFGIFYTIYISRFFIARYTGKAFDYKKEILTAFTLFFPVAGISILYGLIVMGGTILLIVPGIILSYGLILAPLLKIIGGYKGTEEIKASWNLMKGFKLQYFALYIVMSMIITGVIYGAIFILGLIMFGILFVTSGSTAVMVTVGIIIGLVSCILMALIYPVFFAMNVIVLFNRKIVVEGYSVEHSTEEYLNEEFDIE